MCLSPITLMNLQHKVDKIRRLFRLFISKNRLPSLLSLLWFFSAFSAFVLNIFVIIVCVRKRSSLVPADYFIVNLAVSDLILSVVGLPFGISSSFLHRWTFGSGGKPENVFYFGEGGGGLRVRMFSIICLGYYFFLVSEHLFFLILNFFI